MSQKFHLGDLLSVTDGHLVSPDHIDGVYRIIDYTTGIPHFTHQLPRGAEACKPYLIEQHPWLSKITVPGTLRGESEVASWLAGSVAEYGEFHEVNPLPFGVYVGREPFAELEELVGKDRIIPVEIPTHGVSARTARVTAPWRRTQASAPSRKHGNVPSHQGVRVGSSGRR